jgi:beta-mannanase
VVKGSLKHYVKGNTSHRLLTIVTLAVTSCVLVTMTTIDASASGSPLSGAAHLRAYENSAPTSAIAKAWLKNFAHLWNPAAPVAAAPAPASGGGASSGPTTTTPSTTTTTTSPPSKTTTPPPLGVYAGNNNQAGVNNFAATTGAHVTLAETYLPWQANTGTSVGWSYLATQSTLASWLSTWSGTSDQMVIGVPMVALNGSGSPENTLAQGAAGDENANFVAIAKNLVALGFANAILRPGWEFDGNWYPWTVQSNTDAANFAAYWQNIVTAMRSVPGADFKFLWSPAGFQSLSWNINDAYPGNAYVDYVSFDVYDWSWDGTIFPNGDPNNSATVAQLKNVFNEYLTDTEGLNWLASFAQAHNKPIVIPEWAVDSRTDGHGLGDDPTFINDMCNWFITNHVAWVVYFIDDVADNNNQGIDFLLTDGHFPNSLAAFEANFG